VQRGRWLRLLKALGEPLAAGQPAILLEMEQRQANKERELRVTLE